MFIHSTVFGTKKSLNEREKKKKGHIENSGLLVIYRQCNGLVTYFLF